MRLADWKGSVLPEAANDNDWLIILTKPGAEFKAAEHLRAKKISFYLPCSTHWKRSRLKKERAVTPLLPRYLFVSLTHRGGGAYAKLHEVLALDSVSGMVMAGGMPALVPHWVEQPADPEDWRFSISALNTLEREGEFDSTPRDKAPLKAGDTVKIIRGQFQGVLAEIAVPLDGDRYKVVTTGIFAGGMTLDADHLEAA